MVTKAHILEEIKRTAEANGGKPLGVRKFESETGIKEHDWRGKHWTVWSDAICEVGYVPNQLVMAYGSEELLDMYARLAQQLGRLPTSSDLRLKAHNDSEFPHDGPFRRFGGKSQLVERLLEYCQNRERYVDVIRMCREYVPQKKDAANDTVDQAEVFGFVYLIKSGRFYKIGKAKDADYRVGAIRLQLPEKAKRIHTIRTDDPSGIEAYWHKRFEAKRKNGEWFDLNATDVAAFKRRKFM
jgi:Meiotically up-regulated gene 113